MFPPSTALWKKIADGPTLLPEFSLANMMAYFVTRKVCDGQNAVSVPKNLSEEAKPLLNSTVKVNFDQAAAIESSTRKQSENIDWFKYRQCRLTASNFGAVLKRRKKDCSKLVERLTSSHGNLNVSSLNYGRDNEDIVADYYLQYQERNGHQGIKVFPCGLIVNPKYSWLGASPDRIVYDPTSDPLMEDWKLNV
ncbi:uncharacterized protein LOC141865898 [Acropora palmata]|uniref:uncharacterized protein LOC141865898 n=1 Tax=Acropora palmata TaxID=6131 RepID=UPI003DA0CA2E